MNPCFYTRWFFYFFYDNFLQLFLKVIIDLNSSEFQADSSLPLTTNNCIFSSEIFLFIPDETNNDNR